MDLRVVASAGQRPHPPGGEVEQANASVLAAERERGAVGADPGAESADRIAAHDAQRVGVDRVGRLVARDEQAPVRGATLQRGIDG